MAGAAFFDLDKTIIAKSSVLAFGKPFYREGLLSRRAIVKSMYAQIVYMLVGADESKMEEVREAMLSLTKGWQQDHVAQIVRRDARRGDLADRVRRGARAVRRAPRRRAATS